MRISIIIPVPPGVVPQSLERLARVSLPEDVEVIVAEGRCPSRQRNTAAAAASGEILYFLDDDSLTFTGFLERVSRHFADNTVTVVGGPSLTPAGDSAFQRAFGAALGSLVGGGGVRARYRKSGSVRETDDAELILCNLAVRRDVFAAHGGFDERLYPNEENELLDRIRLNGGRLIYDPDFAVTRSQRPTIHAFIRQLFRYGRGRAEQTLISGRVKAATVVPALFVGYLIVLSLMLNQITVLPLIIYALLVLGTCLLEGVRARSPLVALLLPLVIPLLHISYGIGMIYGLMVRSRRRIDSCEVRLRRYLVDKLVSAQGVMSRPTEKETEP